MDLSALEIFRAVAAEGSVTRAAERLGRVQSNVTTRVQQLEEQLGATLFLREGRRMALTPAGTSLVAYADRLLALAEEARQALHPGTPVGRLR
ncbi:LysR family transcriptional regulator, partial [Paracidovorax cattleyae]